MRKLLRQTRAGGRYAHIDALRAAAVTLVVVSHAGITSIPGGTGVTIFFAICGFIITHLLLRERRTAGTFEIRAFYLRRVLKLAPPFVVLILVPTAIYSFFGQINWNDVASQTFFVFNWALLLSDGIHVLPGSDVVWSLAIEEQLYIMFALVWLIIYRFRRHITLLTVLCFTRLPDFYRWTTSYGGNRH